jgi:phosphosulfolactate synthase (CoM biosynthesis protein A)
VPRKAGIERLGARSWAGDDNLRRRRLPEFGYTGVEISDDTLPTFPFETRTRTIKRAASFGLEVFSETGKKFGDGPIRPEDVIDCVKNDLDAGSTKVTVENAECDQIIQLEAMRRGLNRAVGFPFLTRHHS